MIIYNSDFQPVVRVHGWYARCR